MASLLRSVRFNQVLAAHRLGKLQLVPVASMYNRANIGSREVVGFGHNGGYNYFDSADMPYPAIKFKEESAEIKMLREKEKLDWKNLSIEEKRKLYRYNFCLTLSEVEAPNGEWKIHLSIVFMCVSIAIFFIGFARKHFYGPLPSTMTPEGKQHDRDLQILYKTNPIFGLASKYDYEKNDWKKE